MTVSAQTPINRSTGNGVTTVFPYTFKIISDADIEVTVDDVVKTLNVDYTVTGAGVDAGGNVTMTTAPAAATTVVRRRNMGIVRTTDYQDQGALPAATLDADIDSAVLMVQQVNESFNRSLKIPISSTASADLPAPEAGTLLGWNATGDALISVPSSSAVATDLAVTSAAESAASAAASEVSRLASGVSADESAASAVTSEVSNLASGVAQVAAESAQTAAEAARDAALIQAGVYATEVAGRAAVADGVAFKVQGSGDVAAYEYRRVNAGTVSTLIATYPSKAFVDSFKHPNILFDAYNEYSAFDNVPSNYVTWPPVPTFSTTSSNLPLKTPVVIGVAGVQTSKNYEFSILGLKEGDSLNVSVLAWVAALGGTVTVYYRNTSVLSTTVSSAMPSGVSVTNVLTTVPAGSPTYIQIRLTPPASTAFEIGGYFASVGGLPSRNSAPLPASYSNFRQKNLVPDPFFRLAVSGINIDGKPAYSVGAGIASSVALVKSSYSPFFGNNAIKINNGTVNATLDKNINYKHLNLKADVPVTVKVAVYGNMSVSMTWWLRNSITNAISTDSTSGTYVTKVVANNYTEISRTLTLTQGQIDASDYLSIRLLPNQTTTSDVYVLGYGIYQGYADTKLIDETANDELKEKSIEVIRRYRAGEQYLRETRMRLAKLGYWGTLVHGITQYNFGAVGDSWTNLSARWTGPLAARLQSEYGNAGAGYTSFAADLLYPLIYTRSFTGVWSGVTGVVTPDCMSNQSSAAGAKVTLTGPATPLLSAANLFAILTSDGNVRYRWNAGGWTALSLTGTVGELSITNLSTDLPSSGAWTLEIEVVSGTVKLGGIDLQTAVSGVRFHKLGWTGSTADQWASVVASAEWRNGITSLGINCMSIMFGTNDQAGGGSALAFEDDIKTIASNTRISVPYSDVQIVCPCENNRVNVNQMSLYTSPLYDVAVENNYAYLNLQYLFGDSSEDYSALSDRPWFNADLIHPDVSVDGVSGLQINAGGLVIADAQYRMLVQS